MDKRLLILALGMFALGTDTFVVAGVLPEIALSKPAEEKERKHSIKREKLR